jgi:hypothetical protein
MLSMLVSAGLFNKKDKDETPEPKRARKARGNRFSDDDDKRQKYEDEAENGWEKKQHAITDREFAEDLN